MLVTGASSTDVGVRMNIVNIAGNIALLHVAKTTSPLPETQTAQLKAIVLFLLEAATRDVDLRVVAEALDKVIDIFTEDETDQFCVEVKTKTRKDSSLTKIYQSLFFQIREIFTFWTS